MTIERQVCESTKYKVPFKLEFLSTNPFAGNGVPHISPEVKGELYLTIADKETDFKGTTGRDFSPSDIEITAYTISQGNRDTYIDTDRSGESIINFRKIKESNLYEITASGCDDKIILDKLIIAKELEETSKQIKKHSM